MNKISIIIPIYNEVNSIIKLLSHLENKTFQKESIEIIFVDGCSTDDSQEKIRTNSNVKIIQAEKGRAIQMNAGAKAATGNILYFLHCDSLPPQQFDRIINDAVQKGNLAGCFRMKFDYRHPVLMISQWFTRFNHISCRGGDQSLFITKQLFKEIKCFDEHFIIYEDNEIITRLYAKKQFVVLPDYVITSARRYQQNGVWRLQYHFSIIHLKRRLGHSTESMLQYYKKNIL
ncbi:rSAM/selenodomain-associated transferase 2 [Flavobacterium sp. CG_23.5]|uniref:TIGR04283 family arsenosugar biosynthesis glycosyltransferase n=1 Tax=unclassified Flavobacterium TaxID=196869 RepID=UPI0018C973C5|nr:MULTISPECIES: TIGR04283 family arsenosugar biosynthesis glycosyltransferase [unclassified Flavobacterium]MBG6109719.1 rSAM/selenodomain-associated transferase 2 [Flavobacterium sp. CG_9.10]MBP2284753.1 rSAM/selenodomain-associated transferase 2 [Flavobacterium sp. CG_23.5]